MVLEILTAWGKAFYGSLNDNYYEKLLNYAQCFILNKRNLSFLQDSQSRSKWNA